MRFIIFAIFLFLPVLTVNALTVQTIERSCSSSSNTYYDDVTFSPTSIDVIRYFSGTGCQTYFYFSDITWSKDDAYQIDFSVNSPITTSCYLSIGTPLAPTLYFQASDIAYTFNATGTHSYSGVYSYSYSSPDLPLALYLRNNATGNNTCDISINSIVIAGETVFPETIPSSFETVFVPIDSELTALECVTNSPTSTCSFSYSTSTASSTPDYSSYFDLFLLFVGLSFFALSIHLFRALALKYL